MPPALYPTVDGYTPRLRVGVRLDGWTAPAWTADVLGSVRECGCAEIAMVIIGAERDPREGPPERRLLGTFARQPKHLLFQFYRRLDLKWHRGLAAAFDDVDIRPLVRDACFIELPDNGNRLDDDISEVHEAAIRAAALDVLLDFGANAATARFAFAAKYGIWRYGYGESGNAAFATYAFWKMYERDPVSCICLRAFQNAADTHRVIYRSYGATVSYESLLVNQYWMHRKAIPFVARCLRQLHASGTIAVDAQQAMPNGPTDHLPGNLPALRFLSRVVRKMIIARIQDRLRFDRDHWFIAYRWSGSATLPEEIRGRMKPVCAPRGKCWADPMVVKRDGVNFLFLEEKDFRTGLGRIVVGQMGESGLHGEPQVVMEESHHLSYPFVFEWNGVPYLIPETSSARAVRLFKAVEFPARWEFVADLLTDISAADATVFEHDGCWYMFVSVSESGGPQSDELFLFHAGTPLGPWRAHPMNPLVSDVRRARPAGPLFRRGSRLFRPAQDGAATYGHAIWVAEVTALSPTRYEERFAYRIAPDWIPGIYGTHTISFSDDLTVIDGKRVMWQP